MWVWSIPTAANFTISLSTSLLPLVLPEQTDFAVQVQPIQASSFNPGLKHYTPPSLPRKKGSGARFAGAFEDQEKAPIAAGRSRRFPACTRRDPYRSGPPPPCPRPEPAGFP